VFDACFLRFWQERLKYDTVFSVCECSTLPTPLRYISEHAYCILMIRKRVRLLKWCCLLLLAKSVNSVFRNWSSLKCHWDQIVDIHFFTFSYTKSLSERSCQITSYYEHQNSHFLDLYFREFTAAINFPCSKSWLRIGVNDVIFSKIPHE